MQRAFAVRFDGGAEMESDAKRDAKVVDACQRRHLVLDLCGRRGRLVSRGEHDHYFVTDRLDRPPTVAARGILNESETPAYRRQRLHVAQLFVKTGAACDVGEQHGKTSFGRTHRVRTRTNDLSSISNWWTR